MIPIRSSARAVGLAGLGVFLLASACGGSASPGASASTSKSAEGSAPSIDTWRVPKNVACSGDTSTTVEVEYATTDALRRELLVDGLEINGTDNPSSTVSVPVHCDDLPHTFVLIAYGQGGQKTVSQKLLRTQP